MKHERSGSLDFAANTADFDDLVKVVRIMRICPCPQMDPFTVSHICSVRAADRPQDSSSDVPCLPGSFTTVIRGGLWN